MEIHRRCKIAQNIYSMKSEERWEAGVCSFFRFHQHYLQVVHNIIHF